MQVLAAACDRFDNGDPRRLRKPDRTRPIDAAVALALVVQGASIESAASVYNTRGLIAISSHLRRGASTESAALPVGEGVAASREISPVAR
jgi:hypothetical protein